MSIFLVLTFLFFVGSIIGWALELLWRRFFSQNNPERKWLNPGFLNGPYLPLYGLSLCILFSLSFIRVTWVSDRWFQETILFIIMALCITVMEYVAGLIFIKGMHIKLWDYSKNKFNIQGIICLQYTFYWYLLSAVYYFLIHPRILEWLYWFTGHLAFCFVIGFFYGVFTIDVCYTFKLSTRIREFAREKQIEIRYEILKELMRKHREELKEKRSFLFPLKSKKTSLKEELQQIFQKL
ncbi:MAG: putative ABC transporter permease [Spirochaetales bacterium]|nr:putative ABC transporter permease [Spirochaetales bacterium]